MTEHEQALNAYSAALDQLEAGGADGGDLPVLNQVVEDARREAARAEELATAGGVSRWWTR